MNTYTAFCQQTDGKGTIWVSTVEATDVDEAIELAIRECADDWWYDPQDVHCLGIAEGGVNILYWEDIED